MLFDILVTMGGDSSAGCLMLVDNLLMMRRYFSAGWVLLVYSFEDFSATFFVC